MHVLILNQTFYPDIAATAQHMWDLARHLAAQGHDVTAITSRNLYGTDQKLENTDERIGRIRIRRVGGFAFGKKNIAGRLLDFGSFYAAAAFELARMPRVDVIVALTSPPMIASLGGFFRRFAKTPSGGRTRFVYYVMDLYPDAAIASGLFRRNGMLDRGFGFLTRRTLKVADAIIALGRDMQELLVRRYGTAACGDKIHVVHPWADGRDLTPLEPEANPLASELGLAGKFTVLYSGNFGVAHDVETITSAMRETASDATIQWLFIGGGKRIGQLKRQAEASNWTNVRFLPYQDRERLRESLNLGDVHLVSQLPEFTGIVVPSKLFGIMAVGRPIVMIGPGEAECARIISEHEAGLVIPNGRGDLLVKAIRRLRDQRELRLRYGANARGAFDSLFDVRVACRKLEDVLLNKG